MINSILYLIMIICLLILTVINNIIINIIIKIIKTNSKMCLLNHKLIMELKK